MAAAPSVSVALHKENDKDEPFGFDVDVVVVCACGHNAKERTELYKESDTVNVFCAACGAEYDVAVRTSVHFEAGVSAASEGFLATGVHPSAVLRQGGPHVE